MRRMSCDLLIHEYRLWGNARAGKCIVMRFLTGARFYHIAPAKSPDLALFCAVFTRPGRRHYNLLMSNSIPSVTPHAGGKTARQIFLAGLALAVAGAILFSAKAIVVKLLYREHVDAISVLAFRMLFSLPFFGVIACIRMRQSAPLLPSDRWRLVVLGLLGYYLSSYLDFIGLLYISAGLERLILFLTPSFVLLLSVFLFKRRVDQREWVALIICYSGTVLVFVHDVQTSGNHVLLGGAFVFASAVFYALYLLFSGELVRRVGTSRLVSYVMCVSGAAAVGQFLLLRPWTSLVQPPVVYGLSLVNAVFCTVLPVFFTMMAIARVGAGVSALAGMVGPVSTLFLAALILDEPITTIQLAGTALVIGGMTFLSRKHAR